MTDSAPALGLLLDVDGPIASPVSRTVAIPDIASDLVALANAGVPIAFNTGRSDAFLAAELIPPLRAAGLADDVLVWGVCEKGAVWMRITGSSTGDVTIDDELRMPSAFAADVETLVDDSYADLVFYDRTKRAMVSVEQRTDVSSEVYLDRQGGFNGDVAEILARHDLGYEWEGDRHPDSAGAVDYRIDPTIISTDIESNRVGKDLGASRVLQFLREEGAAIPRRWRTMGDSRTDYAMSDWLHENGFDVAHVDVRPSDGVPDKPYPIRKHASLIHDDAGALYVRRWVEMVRGEADDDADV